MMNKLLFIFFIFSLFLLSGCVEEETGESFCGGKPYLEYEKNKCCVDLDDNLICDEEERVLGEPEEEVVEEPVEEPEVVEEPEEPKTIELEVGESAKISNLKMALSSLSLGPSYSYTDKFKEEKAVVCNESDEFVIIRVEIENVGNENLFLGGGSFSVQDENGTEYVERFSQYENRLNLFQDLGPGEGIEGTVIFLVPRDPEEIRVVYDFSNPFEDVKFIYWKY